MTLDDTFSTKGLIAHGILRTTSTAKSFKFLQFAHQVSKNFEVLANSCEGELFREAIVNQVG